MTSRAAEVVVVGAGPAGAVTALLLARAGRDVALVDRRAFPRPKACGDCLSPAAGRILARIGLLRAVEEARPARLGGWRIFSPAGYGFGASFDSLAGGDALLATGFALERERLDATLFDAAVSAGARPLMGYTVRDVLRDRAGRVSGIRARAPEAPLEPLELRARAVIGADGLRSIVARRLGLVRRAPRLRKVSLTIHPHGLACDAGRGEMHLADGACIGIAPAGAAPDGDERERRWNVTLVVDSARFGRAVGADPAAFFRAMLARFPRLPRGLERAVAAELDRDPAAELGRDSAAPPGPAFVPLASGPFDWPVRANVVDGAALVGDAAGYFDPFTGQGIHHALESAELLAGALEGALRRGRVSAGALGGYSRGQRALARRAHRFQRLVELVTSRPRLCDLAVTRLAHSPAAAEALIAAAGDLAPSRALLHPAVLLGLLTGGSPPPQPPSGGMLPSGGVLPSGRELARPPALAEGPS